VSQQPPLFELPELPAHGWHPATLGVGAQAYWAVPAEIEPRLDAAYYVIARRPERLLNSLKCTLTPLTEWADVNPVDRRLPAERGYILYDHCRYVEIRDVPDGCWALAPRLRALEVKGLPGRAAYRLFSGDLLLPRHIGSLHKIALVGESSVDGGLPLIASDVFVLLRPHSQEDGLALLALLHHRVLGEQLWALASGTTTRSITAADVQSLRVPQLRAEVKIDLAARINALLHAQIHAAYPGALWPVALYWQDGTLAQWQQRSNDQVREIEQCIDRALSEC
jgi:hypothetical protein